MSFIVEEILADEIGIGEIHLDLSDVVTRLAPCRCLSDHSGNAMVYAVSIDMVCDHVPDRSGKSGLYGDSAMLCIQSVTRYQTPETLDLSTFLLDLGRRCSDCRKMRHVQHFSDRFERRKICHV
jgi:hypothetical protein